MSFNIGIGDTYSKPQHCIRRLRISNLNKRKYSKHKKKVSSSSVYYFRDCQSNMHYNETNYIRPFIPERDHFKVTHCIITNFIPGEFYYTGLTFTESILLIKECQEFQNYLNTKSKKNDNIFGDVITMFYKNQKIRWLFKKLLFHYINKTKEKKVINTTDLCGRDKNELIEENIKPIFIYNSKNKRSYMTHYDELCEHISSCLNYRMENGFNITPKYIKNPYTNEIVPSYVLHDILLSCNVPYKYRSVRLFKEMCCNLTYYKCGNSIRLSKIGISDYCNDEENMQYIISDFKYSMEDFFNRNKKYLFLYHKYILNYFWYYRKNRDIKNNILKLFITHYKINSYMDNGIYQYSIKFLDDMMLKIINNDTYLKHLNQLSLMARNGRSKYIFSSKNIDKRLIQYNFGFKHRIPNQQITHYTDEYQYPLSVEAVNMYLNSGKNYIENISISPISSNIFNCRGDEYIEQEELKDGSFGCPLCKCDDCITIVEGD